MKTRSHPTPKSIWFIAIVWSLAGLAPLLKLVPSTWAESWPIAVAVTATTSTLAAYNAIALIRLSRWPVVLALVSIAWSVIQRSLAHFDWRQHYPMLGVFAFLAPAAILLACTLPHWRKMSWDLFGLPYRRPEDPVEVFG